MPEQFIIRVEARFEAAHNLRQYKGAPEPLHGHSWKVEAKFKCRQLDHEDIGIDYVHAEDTLRGLAKKFDHKYINEVPPFDKMNPTSENIAKWFFEELNQPDIRQNAELAEVVVWEGPEAYVSYSKE
ncbi:MAG: 6-carboxytetrahydropterin synthase [Candidatus Omnitrophica bacterium]|nr:6-carboxytetrahydropterin synthase [Candidatus Omnitrophota bacterium]